jgi:hypothetical protein
MCDYTLVDDGTTCGEGECLDGVCAPVGAFACTEQGIRDAIAEGGGPHFFACDGPTTVVTEAEIVIDNDAILDGRRDLTVDGNKAHRVFLVLENVTVELRGFTVTKGFGYSDWWGGGIMNFGALTLTHSIVSDSESPGESGQGGGIYNYDHATLTMTHSTVSGNTAGRGGGITNRGMLTMTHSTVSGNRAYWHAGGIDNDVDTYYTGRWLTMTHSTVSGNTAALAAGGIYNFGPLTVVASTLSQNTSDTGRPSIFNGGALTLTNSLVNDDCELNVSAYASITSTGYTIESPGDTCGLDQPTDQVNVSADDLKLGPLQDNGGPTMTHALGAGSVAIDHIPAVDCEVNTDQRGLPRPAGTTDPKRCDVGAFEVQP